MKIDLTFTVYRSPPRAVPKFLDNCFIIGFTYFPVAVLTSSEEGVISKSSLTVERSRLASQAAPGLGRLLPAAPQREISLVKVRNDFVVAAGTSDIQGGGGELPAPPGGVGEGSGLVPCTGGPTVAGGGCPRCLGLRLGTQGQGDLAAFFRWLLCFIFLLQNTSTHTHTIKILFIIRKRRKSVPCNNNDQRARIL